MPQVPQPTPDVNRALKELCDELHVTTADLGRLVGVEYPTAHRWLHPTAKSNGPSLYYITIIEDRLGVMRGEILRRAGRVASPLSIADYLRADPNLSNDRRQVVVDIYLKAVEESSIERFKNETASGPSSAKDANAADAS